MNVAPWPAAERLPLSAKLEWQILSAAQISSNDTLEESPTLSSCFVTVRCNLFNLGFGDVHLFSFHRAERSRCQGRYYRLLDQESLGEVFVQSLVGQDLVLER